MMALEDVAVLVRLLKAFVSPTRDMMAAWPMVLALYEKLRIPRTTTIYRSSHALGKMQLHRAENRSWLETASEEWGIWWNVKRFGTLPLLRMASGFNAIAEAESAAKQYLANDDTSRRTRAKL